MANIYKGALELIGNTPLVEMTNIEKELKLEATICQMTESSEVNTLHRFAWIT